MSIMKVDYGEVGGDANVWRTTGTYDNNASAEITDCPFEPDIVFAYFYTDDNNRVVSVGGSVFNKFSAGVASGTGYSFGNYGITVTGNTISIVTGFNISKNHAFDLIAIKNN